MIGLEGVPSANTAGRPNLNRLWTHPVGLAVCFGLALNALLIVFGGHNILAVLESSGLLIVAALLHGVVFDDKLFATNRVDTAGHYTKEATLFGHKVAATNRSKIFGLRKPIFFFLRAVLAIAIYLYVLKNASGHELAESGLVGNTAFCGFAILLALNNRFVWVPVCIMFVSHLILVRVSKSHLANIASITSGITILAFFMSAFAVMTKRAMDGNLRPTDFRDLKIIMSIFPQFYRVLTVAIIAYGLVQFRDGPPKENERQQPRSSRQYVDSKGEVGKLRKGSGVFDQPGDVSGSNNSVQSDHSEASGNPASAPESAVDGAESLIDAKQDFESSTPARNSVADGASSASPSAAGGQDAQGGVNIPGGKGNEGREPKGGGFPGPGRDHEKLSTKIVFPPKFNFKFKRPNVVLLVILTFAVCIFIYWMKKQGQSQSKRDKEAKSHRQEKIKQALTREIETSNGALWAEMNAQGAIRDRIINLYNQWIEFNFTEGLERYPNMTPEEYYYHYVAKVPQRSLAVRTVTDIYSRVYFGNELPDEASWQRYCRAIQHCI